MFVELFDEGNHERLPLLKMELIYEDDKMQFYPPYEDLEETVLAVVDQITNTLQSVCAHSLYLAFNLLADCATYEQKTLCSSSANLCMCGVSTLTTLNFFFQNKKTKELILI